MINTLKDQEKAINTEPESGAGVAARASDSSGSVEQKDNPQITSKDLEEAKKAKAWNESIAGRFMIRGITRGIIGAAAFTLGGYMASRAHGLKGYHPDMKWSEVASHPEGWKAWFNPSKSPIPRVIAKLYDELMGRPIRHSVTALAKTGMFGKYAQSKADFIGKRAVTFRQTSCDHLMEHWGVYGRSFGEEIVGVTQDFAFMSTADALARDVADVIDPANKDKKSTWRDEKGNIKWLESAKAVGYRILRAVTFNAGEDWWIAPAYIYQIHGQGIVLDKIFPGFRYDQDRGLNGGSYRVDNHGKIIGNYQLPGLIDLQLRFMGYNGSWFGGTLAFRELYNKVENALQGKHVNLYGDPHEKPDPNRGIVERGINTAKWLMRAVVKGSIYMVPSVPLFWIMRTPQTKYKGALINPEKNAVAAYVDMAESRKKGSIFYDAVHMDELNRHHDNGRTFNQNTSTMFRKYNGQDLGWSTVGSVANPLTERVNPEWIRKDLHNGKPEMMPYAKSFGIFDSVLNTIGKAYNKVRKLGHHIPLIHSNDPTTTRANKRIMDRFINASVPYWIYMAGKAEFARLVDTGKTDFAIERTIDSAARGDLSGVAQGTKQIIQATTNQPFDDPELDKEGERRRREDESAADAALENTELMNKNKNTNTTEEKLNKSFAKSLKEQNINNSKNKNNIRPNKNDDLSWKERQTVRENQTAMSF